MSERQFQIRKQEERLRQIPHSEKSAVSAKESHASKQEAARLTTKLHSLASSADWAQNRAEMYWKKAKEFEAQGMMDWALEAKVNCENEAHRAKCYNQEIKEVEKMIDKLSLIYSVGIQKGANYAMMKLEQPPSDNEV